MNVQIEKMNVGNKATEFIKDGMVIGLGSGTTVYWMMKKLGELIKQGLRVTGIPTSNKTEGWAKELGIPLSNLTHIDKIDLTIDGANEIDRNLYLIKGGGGSLVREKIIGHFSRENIIIVNQNKLSLQLGGYPLPVEVIPFGLEVTSKFIEEFGCKAELRKRNNEVFVSDNGNFILDCKFETINNPGLLHKDLKMIPGVVETGLFLNMTDKVIIGNKDSVEIIESTK